MHPQPVRRRAAPTTLGAVTDCLFCKIAAGQVPAETVLETETVVAFRDIAPRAAVHVLVVPRAHHETLAAMAAADPQGAADVMVAAGRVAEAEGIAGSGYRLVSNVGADGGQEVAHVHVHVLGGQRLGVVATPRG